MRKSIINNVIEYSSLALILSYLYFHNILPVLLGICLSLYLINKEFAIKLARTLRKSLKNIKEIKVNIKDHKAIDLNTNYCETKKIEVNSTLVETVEEFGFIPSLDNHKNGNNT